MFGQVVKHLVCVFQAQDYLASHPSFPRILSTEYDVSFHNPLGIDMGLYLAKNFWNSSTVYFSPASRQQIISVDTTLNPTGRFTISQCL